MLRNIADLLRDGTIDVSMAAYLWAMLARAQSIAVIGGSSGIGKTTLLTALLDFLPPDTRRVYVRGCFESFAFLHDPRVEPARTALLVNEISPHLPVYLWGTAVARMLDSRERGFTLLSTAHGGSVQDFAGSLTGSPLRIPAASVAAFDLVAVLKPSPQSASGRRVTDVWRLRATRNGLGFTQVLPAVTGSVRTDVIPAAVTEGQDSPPGEIGERARLLIDLRDGAIADLPRLIALEDGILPRIDDPIDTAGREALP